MSKMSRENHVDQQEMNDPKHSFSVGPCSRKIIILTLTTSQSESDSDDDAGIANAEAEVATMARSNNILE
jgi:hypothetical protein